MGEYILLVDADTRVPGDCLLDAVSEMQQDPNVAIMQFTTVPFMVTANMNVLLVVVRQLAASVMPAHDMPFPAHDMPFPAHVNNMVLELAP